MDSDTWRFYLCYYPHGPGYKIALAILAKLLLVILTGGTIYGLSLGISLLLDLVISALANNKNFTGVCKLPVVSTTDFYLCCPLAGFGLLLLVNLTIVAIIYRCKRTNSYQQIN